MVPVIETKRLRLREFRQSDLDPQAETLRDEAVVRHLGGRPFGREDVWRKMVTGRGLWELLGYGYWCVERVEDGAYLGQIGFADFKRGMEPSIEGIPEMGWIFAPAAQGQGYATEAGAAALQWADVNLGPREFVAIISHANAASIRVAEKCGFSMREEATYNDAPILLFRRPPSPAPTAAAASASA